MSENVDNISLETVTLYINVQCYFPHNLHNPGFNFLFYKHRKPKEVKWVLRVEYSGLEDSIVYVLRALRLCFR